MTHEHLNDELLQRHFDGELEPDEETGVRQALSDCETCNARLESLEKLSRLIRMATRDAEQAASDADFNGMFARIERATQEPARATVLRPTGAAHSKWFRPAVMSGVGALAVAAAVLLLVSRPDSSPNDATYKEDADGTLAALETSHSEITHVDFGPNAGAVFDIAYDDGSSTPVVWIDDDDYSEE
jgi:anti-sigma factor RsiW